MGNWPLIKRVCVRLSSNYTHMQVISHVALEPQANQRMWLIPV